LVDRSRQIPGTVQPNQAGGNRSGDSLEFIDIAAQLLELSYGVIVTPQLIEGLSRCEDFIETGLILPSLLDDSDLFVSAKVIFPVILTLPARVDLCRFKAKAPAGVSYCVLPWLAYTGMYFRLPATWQPRSWS